MFDPTEGAFLTEDPSGFSGGDYNLYRYAGGDPATYSDPTGLAIYLDPNAGFSPQEVMFARLLDPNKLVQSNWALRPGDPRLQPGSYQIRSDGNWEQEGSNTDFQYQGDDLPNPEFQPRDLYQEYLNRQGWAYIKDKLSYDITGRGDDEARYQHWVDSVAYVSRAIDSLNQKTSGKHDGVIYTIDLSAGAVLNGEGSVSLSPIAIYVNWSTGTFEIGGNASVTYGFPGIGASVGVSGGSTIYCNADGVEDAGGKGEGAYLNTPMGGVSGAVGTGSSGQTVPSVSVGMGAGKVGGGGASAGENTIKAVAWKYFGFKDMW